VHIRSSPPKSNALTELLIFYVGLSYHEGVDEATIVEVLAKRTNAQRQQIKAASEVVLS